MSIGETREFRGMAKTSVMSRAGLAAPAPTSHLVAPYGHAALAARREQDRADEAQKEQALARAHARLLQEAATRKRLDEQRKRKHVDPAEAAAAEAPEAPPPPSQHDGLDGAASVVSDLHPMQSFAAAAAAAAAPGMYDVDEAENGIGADDDNDFGAGDDVYGGGGKEDAPAMTAAATAAAAAAASHHMRHSVAKIIHVKATPTLRPFELPAAHAYLVEMNLHVRALYYFMRKLAGCEPYNPATRMASYLPQWKEDRMTALWPVTRTSPEYFETEKLRTQYANDLNESRGNPMSIARIEHAFKVHFKSNMKFFIDGAAYTAINNAYTQLRRTEGAQIATLSLPTLLTFDALTNVFVHVVNAHMQMASAGTSYRGLSDAAALRMQATHKSHLDTLVNARRVVHPADGSVTWQFSM